MDEIKMAVYCIAAIIELYVLYDFFHDDYEKRFDNYWPSLPLALCIIAFNTIVPMYALQMNSVLNLVMTWILIRFTYIGTRRQLFRRYFGYMFITCASEMICVGISYAITKISVIYQDLYLWIVIMFSAKIINIILCKLAKKYVIKSTQSYDGKTLLFMILQSAFMFMLLYFSLAISSILEEAIGVYVGIFGIVWVAIGFVMLMAADWMNTLERTRRHYNELLLKTDMERQYYAKIEEIDKQQTIYRHDMKQYLSVIAGLAEQGKCEDITQMISTMNEEIKAITPKVYTSSGMLNALLGEKENVASKENVKIAFTIEPDVNVSFIKDTDMIAMFGNLLDNAIRAEKKCNGDRTVNVRLFETEGSFLMFCVENHFEGEIKKEGNRFITTKANKEKHGLGIESVKNLAGKYGGILTLREEKNMFYADLLLSKKYAS